ncbi:MAG: DUF4114 domain-containing protein, partial [Nostocales cyanobacterium]
DSLAEGNHNGSIQHTVTSTDTAYNNLAIPAVNVGISEPVINNSNPTIRNVIRHVRGSSNLTEGGSSYIYSVLLSTQPTANVTLTINSGDQLTTNVNQLVFTPQNWNIAQNVTVTAVDDSVVEGSQLETITHTFSSSDTRYDAITINAVNINITDNDPGVIITQPQGNTKVLEGGTANSYRVVLNTQPTADVVLNINSSNQVSTNVNQVIFTPQNWNVSQIVAVSAIDDNVIEGNHTTIIQHTAISTDSRYNGINVNPAQVDIKDNDFDLSTRQRTPRTVPTSTRVSPLAAIEMLDLRSFSNAVTAEFIVNGDAARNNFVGFYKVADLNGGIDTNNDGRVDIQPGSVGYTQAAVANRLSGVDLIVNSAGTSTFNTTLNGGSMYAPFIIVNGTPDAIVDSNRSNDPNVYFSFVGANSDNTDHVNLLGNNVFGFEDTLGGGDLNYQDMTVQVNVSAI